MRVSLFYTNATWVCTRTRISLALSHAARDVGKVHGGLARAGKVKGQTPKVEKTEKKKQPRGRAKKRMLYTKRFVNVVVGPGKKKGPNSQTK